MSKQINFAAVTANSDIEIKVAKILNPNTVLSEVLIGVSLYTHQGTTGTYVYLHYDKFSLFIDTQSIAAGAD